MLEPSKFDSPSGRSLLCAGRILGAVRGVQSSSGSAVFLLHIIAPFREASPGSASAEPIPDRARRLL